MKLRIIALGVLVLSLSACIGDSSKSMHHDAQNQDSEVDFHKAALLNVEMGEQYLASGQISRAKQKFIHALELKPKLPEAHTSIGYFYEKVGDLEEAERHYKQAISYGDGKGRFYNNYGTFLCRQSRFKEADKAFNTAIKDKQYINTAEVYENAGLCALREPDVEKAYTYLRTAVRRDPGRAVANLELAKLEFSKNNYLGAKEYLNNFNNLSAATAPSLWLAIQIDNKLGDRRELADNAAKLKKLFPKSPQYRLYVESIRHE